MLAATALLQRREAIARILTLTEDTSLLPPPYERQLWERYIRGDVALEDIPALFASRVHHILYRSRATHLFEEGDLTRLVTTSRANNARRDITGLLCYCDGYFVQYLEGPELAVLDLYDIIQQDPRHERIETLSNAAGPTRWFDDWRLALTTPPPTALYWMLPHLEARMHTLGQPQIPITDPYLLTLLESFNNL